MSLNEIVVLDNIRSNKKWMKKIASEKNDREKYNKAKGIVIAACREAKVKLSEEELRNVAFRIYR